MSRSMKNKMSLVGAVVICLILLGSSCLPDLKGVIECPDQAYPGQELGDAVKVNLENSGKKAAGEFVVDLILSTDTVIPVELAEYSPNFTEDVLLQGGRENVESLGKGEVLDLELHGTNKIPDDTPPGDYYLGLVVDAGKSVSETSEDNNTAHCAIEVVACDPIADITSCQILEASGGTVGFARMKIGWGYGAGERPHTLFVTIYRGSEGAWDNIMPSEEPFEVSSPATTTVADITIFRLFHATYRIVFEASYSCGREEEFVFIREI